MWDGCHVPVLTAEQVGLAVELGREVLGHRVHFGVLARAHQGQDPGLEPRLDKGSSSEPWGQALGSGLCVLGSVWSLRGASE